MDQSQRPRYVSRFEHLALHPRLHHRVGFPIHYLPPREPLPKRICYNSRSTELLSQYKHHLTQGGRPLAKQPTPLPKRVTTNLHLSLEGANHNLNTTTSTSTKEGATQEIKGLQQVVYLNHKPLSFFSFPQNNDPNRLG